jgi:hypothetical protein
MIKYAKIVNQETGLCEVGTGTNAEFYQSIGMSQLDVDLSDVDGNWYLASLCPHKSEEQKEEEERIRIANLHMTRGDVFRGLLLAKGVTRADMRGLIEAMPEETPEQRMAKEYALIDFDEALEFYRGVALIDTVGEQLGITPTQMDKFFDTKDWHELVNEVENADTTNEQSEL